MIRPTPGRVVWFWPWSSAVENAEPGVPLAAIVAYVHDEEHVNLMVIGKDGQPHATALVYLWHGEGERPKVGSFCEWMPYQKGQAAKVEELERAIKEGYTKP